MSEHTCHAKHCETPVPPRMFMCRRHWYALPRPLRAKIWATYRPGQEVDKQTTPAYRAAAYEAINWLADRSEP